MRTCTRPSRALALCTILAAGAVASACKCSCSFQTWNEWLESRSVEASKDQREQGALAFKFGGSRRSTRTLCAVVDVQLTSVRSKVGFDALTRMGQSPPKGYESRSRLTVTDRPHLTYTFATTAPHASASTAVVASSQQQQQQQPPTRILELHQGNLFDFGPNQAWTTDLLICETNIDVSMQYDFLHFLAHCKNGCRLLTYNSLENMYEDVCARLATGTGTGTAAAAANERKSFNGELVKPPFPWKRMDINTYVRTTAHARVHANALARCGGVCSSAARRSV